MTTEELLASDIPSRVEAAIRAAELGTSGEIRVHIDDTCPEDVLDHAAFLFSELGMHRTEQRNGVLIYVSLQDHKLAIIGDAGIHAQVGAGFWDDVRKAMTARFQSGDLAGGLTEGVRLTGEKLQAFFPYLRNDVNELSNTISTGR